MEFSYIYMLFAFLGILLLVFFGAYIEKCLAYNKHLLECRKTVSKMTDRLNEYTERKDNDPWLQK